MLFECHSSKWWNLWACGLLVFRYTVLFPRDHMVSHLSRFTRMPPLPPILHPLVECTRTICVHTPRGEGAVWEKPLLEMLSFSKGGVHLCGCTVNYWSTFRHTSLTSQRLYTLSQCYTGCFFARNSGMVWIIGILTAWEQRSRRPPIPNSSLSS